MISTIAQLILFGFLLLLAGIPFLLNNGNNITDTISAKINKSTAIQTAVPSFRNQILAKRILVGLDEANQMQMDLSSLDSWDSSPHY